MRLPLSVALDNFMIYNPVCLRREIVASFLERDSLEDINKVLDSYIKAGIYRESDDGYVFRLKIVDDRGRH